MKKLIASLILAIVLSVTPANADIKQPVFDKKTWTVTYMGYVYKFHGYYTGIAGYKTLDDVAQLLKMVFVDNEGNRINMVQIVSQKEELDIVGFGFDIEGHKYAIEDSNCDGVFETVKLYEDLVFPPDCFHPEQEIKDALEI